MKIIALVLFSVMGLWADDGKTQNKIATCKTVAPGKANVNEFSQFLASLQRNVKDADLVVLADVNEKSKESISGYIKVSFLALSVFKGIVEEGMFTPVDIFVPESSGILIDKNTKLIFAKRVLVPPFLRSLVGEAEYVFVYDSSQSVELIGMRFLESRLCEEPTATPAPSKK